MKFKILVFLLTVLGVTAAHGQEIKYTVKVNTPTLQMADPAVFKNLEKTVTEFLNNQQWTDDKYEDQEKINCNLQINLNKEYSAKDFGVTLSYLATRPVYGSNYESVIFQTVDEKVAFTFEPGTTLIFNPNTFSDPLTSVLAFYSYIILGLDKDSFQEKGGDEMYSIAQNIVSTLPTNVANGDDYGWSVAKTSLNKTRSALVENLLSPKLGSFRTGFYEYHRQGLDVASSNIENSRKAILNAMKGWEKSYDAYVNSMVINLIGNIKGPEIVEVFKEGSREEKNEVYRILLRLDPAGAQKYLPLRS